jgi:ferrous iron transport protein A
MSLAEISLGATVTVERVGGERSYRRRLMELGLVPGTRVQVMGVAPLGDPIELLVRGASLSIRRAEAGAIAVRQLETTERRQAAAPGASLAASESLP